MYHNRLLYLLVILSLLVTPSLGRAESNSMPLKSLDSTSFLGDTTTIQNDFGKTPTTISADTLTLRTLERTFSYKGNVRVVQGALNLSSDEIAGQYTEQNEITTIKALGRVVITKEDMKATSQQALYDATASKVVLTDNPQLQQGESVLTADVITIFLAENRSAAEGNVRVTFVKQPGPADSEAGKPAQGSASAIDKNNPNNSLVRTDVKTTETEQTASIDKDKRTRRVKKRGKEKNVSTKKESGYKRDSVPDDHSSGSSVTEGF